MFRIKASIFFSVFVAMLSLMLISPIMPPLIRELGLSESHSGWIISLGSVWMAIMAPTAPDRSHDRHPYGAKRNDSAGMAFA